MIRMETDRLGGITYTLSNLNDFLVEHAPADRSTSAT